ncbi:hypothetical protein LTR95_018905, partial [Oleoguttula sp. CCFEE 5521]
MSTVALQLIVRVVSSGVSDATSKSECDTLDHIKRNVLEWRRNARSFAPRPTSTRKSSSDELGSPPTPEMMHTTRTTKSKNAPQYSDNWCTTKAAFKGHTSPPSIREHIAFDPGLYKHVGGLEGLGKRRSIEGPLTKDGESIDVIQPMHVIQHKTEHLFKRGKAPRDTESSHVEERPNGMEVLIKCRMWIV